MTVDDAARALGQTEAWVHLKLHEFNIPFTRTPVQTYFGARGARRLFQFQFNPLMIAFHIVKGGTGKTSLVYETAIRASLYGAKVLCIDMDQQGNLTHAFNQNADTVPVMVDCLLEGYALRNCLLQVNDGIDLIPSRFENSLLDEAIRLKKHSLETVYKNLFQELKYYYDLILIDCPPSMGQSVTAIALAVDWIIAPVTLEKFAISGLEISEQSIQELRQNYHKDIPFNIVLNKFDLRSTYAQETLHRLKNYPKYQNQFLKSEVRLTNEIPNATAKNRSIFDVIKNTQAKMDIDALTCEILGVGLEKAEKHSSMNISNEMGIEETT